MEINVVDTNDPWMVKPLIQLKAWNKNIVEIQSGPNGVQRMVNAIIQKAGSTHSIDVLRIYAHGRPGAINIAGGQIDAQDELSGIGLDSLAALKPQLQALTSYFAPGARVELLGCEVARGSDGEKLLLALGGIWFVKVHGQTFAVPIGTLQFGGEVIQANPGGGLSSTVGAELTKN
jgi:hypothetical protein